VSGDETPCGPANLGYAAEACAAAGEEFRVFQSVTLTQTATIMGSPLYMPPEQMAASKSVDARADIWALGIILYELMAGVAPFAGETLPEVCMKIAIEAPRPIRELCPDVSEELEAGALLAVALAGLTLGVAHWLRASPPAAGSARPALAAQSSPPSAQPHTLVAPSPAPSMPAAPSVPELGAAPDPYAAAPRAAAGVHRDEAEEPAARRASYQARPRCKHRSAQPTTGTESQYLR
jgi:serine/threonine protein kinase